MNLRFNSLLLIITLVISTFTSCKKDKDPATPTPPVPPSPTASMTAKVDGAAWTSLSNRTEATILNIGSFLGGIASDSSVIIITVDGEFVLNGNYSLNYMSDHAGVFMSDNSGTSPAWTSNSYPTNTGNLTITAMDPVNKRISGTFNFRAWRGSDNSFKDITNGVFTNVNYETSGGPGSNNTFTVKVNNVVFNPVAINGSINGSDLMLVGSDIQGERSVSLSMPTNIAVGTHPISPIFSGPIFGMYNHDNSTYTGSTGGTLVILSHNTTTKKILGTFNFNSDQFGGPPTFNLTDGSFDITYQ